MKKGICLLLVISTLILIQINHQSVLAYEDIDLSTLSTKFSHVEQIAPKIAQIPYPSGTINITSNNDFLEFDFTGNGLSGSPYILSEYTITSSTNEPIHIENTNASFVISGCMVDGEDWTNNAISLINVTNGIIVGNTIKNGVHGIRMSEGCNDIVIDNNDIVNNSEMGIGHYDSDHNNITNNRISINGYSYDSSAVGFGSSSIHGGSSVQQGGGQGIYLDPSNFTIISGNSIHHNKDDGIHVIDSDNITISDNCIYDNGFSTFVGTNTFQGPISFKVQQGGGQGIYLDPSNNNTIYHNVFLNNSEYGVKIVDGTNNVITFNDFIGNNDGSVQAYDDDSDVFYNNIFSSNYWSDDPWSSEYSIDGGAENVDSNPRNSSNLTLICPSLTTQNTEVPASSFSFSVLLLSLLTVTLIIRKKNRFQR